MPLPSSEARRELDSNRLVNSMKRYGVDFDCRSKNVLSFITAAQEKETCLFCLGTTDNPDEYGEFIHHKTSGIWVHYFCLLLASNLEQNSDESHYDVRETPTAIYGFRIQDIFREFKRGSKLICSLCHRLGATIGCSVMKCRRKFHFKCGLERHFLFRYYGSFPAFCKVHRPTQSCFMQVTDNATCNVCLEAINPATPLETLCAPCCKATYFHRECVKKQALSSGSYFFRCPMCNNKEDYMKEMLQMGIYIPDRDASWETPDAFSELLEPARFCDIECCKCEHGRKYDKSGTIWSISVCVLCGASRAHVACAMLQSLSSPYVCDICYSISGQTGVRKALLGIGFETRSPMFTSDVNTQQQMITSSTCRTVTEENLDRCVTRSRKRKRECEALAASSSASETLEIHSHVAKNVRC